MHESFHAVFQVSGLVSHLCPCRGSLCLPSPCVTYTLFCSWRNLSLSGARQRHSGSSPIQHGRVRPNARNGFRISRYTGKDLTPQVALLRITDTRIFVPHTVCVNKLVARQGLGLERFPRAPTHHHKGQKAAQRGSDPAGRCPAAAPHVIRRALIVREGRLPCASLHATAGSRCLESLGKACGVRVG